MSEYTPEKSEGTFTKEEMLEFYEKVLKETK
jgi:hypothetical protein